MVLMSISFINLVCRMEVEPGEYQKLQIHKYPPRSFKETAEGKFWDKFKS